MSTTETTMAAIAGEAVLKNFTFGPWDYVVFLIMLCISAGIGAYFGFFAKIKNTTEEYLMGGKKMQTLPIAISLVASQLSGIAIMTVPAETYNFGFNYFFLSFSIIFVVPILCFIIAPVFYENHFNNCYEYLQVRFNKRTRQIVTATFVLHAILMLPVYIFVPALAFSQVTGINLHLINGIVCSICIFYTMLGGIKAVVWTDVVQGTIMLSTVSLVTIMGIIKVGGMGVVLENAEKGGRLDVEFSLDPRVRQTVYSGLINGILLWTGHVGLNQSCVQRMVSLPSIKHAKKAITIAGVGILGIMGFGSFQGLVMFARYMGCDPIKAGLVEKADKLLPFFVQDIIGHLKGMPGLFISCVFSAALSTMSANMNSVAGVVYFDYIKPFVKHTDAKANAIMKGLVVGMGIYCILGGYIVQHFKSILQVSFTVSGINTGAVVGIFLLGMFVPRVNGKVGLVSFIFAVCAMTFIIINTQYYIKTGAIKYSPLPTTIDKCEALHFPVLIKSLNETTSSAATIIKTSVDHERPFFLFEISFFWYKLLGSFLVWVCAIPLSFVWKREEDEKLNPKLLTPIMRKFFNLQVFEMEEMPLKESKENGVVHTTILLTDKEKELQ